MKYIYIYIYILFNCNNYLGISLINVGLKVISKAITDSISKYTFENKFIRSDQFCFLILMKNVLLSIFLLEKSI